MLSATLTSCRIEVISNVNYLLCVPFLFGIFQSAHTDFSFDIPFNVCYNALYKNNFY